MMFHTLYSYFITNFIFIPAAICTVAPLLPPPPPIAPEGKKKKKIFHCLLKINISALKFCYIISSVTSSRCDLGDVWWMYHTNITSSKAWNFKGYWSCKAILPWIWVSAVMVLSPVLHRNNSFLSLPLYCLVTDRPAVLERPQVHEEQGCNLAMLPVSVHLHLLSREPEALQNIAEQKGSSFWWDKESYGHGKIRANPLAHGLQWRVKGRITTPPSTES